MNPRPDNIFQSFSDQLSLKVEAVEVEAEGVLSLVLTDGFGGALPAWEPGAHIDLILSPDMTRQYSLCGDPAERDRWRIGVLLAPDSRGGSQFVHTRLHAGDIVQVVGPRNNFRLVEAEHHLFIAGGIGITPILPMIREVAAKGGRWTLLYGGRTENSMAFVKEIQELSGGDVHLVPQDKYGLLDLKRFLAAHKPGQVVYCCGPSPLIDAVEALCAGWPSGSLHQERFAPRARQEVGEDGEFEVELASSGRTLSVPAGKSLLKVLEEAGCKISNSCRAGICGTCLVKVLDGVPEHNDDLLDDEQRESGTVILPCVSRSKTKTLILDL
ncbi:oxidoreductase [Pseudaminobacter arsenicus]|uniref:Oxidoreductase n=1 Tax=Borborobacter arsenicus TaxID=1851146 RepID=A0A432V4R1_9HYPH|nr:PDR/VanB family oxidoreductase [Pseudaminobacter arsenicus]RUM97146.1 oxidoreductase [Pseudaminobacter arsenicus]